MHQIIRKLIQKTVQRGKMQVKYRSLNLRENEECNYVWEMDVDKKQKCKQQSHKTPGIRKQEKNGERS
jgi:predicted secreted protein